MSEFVDGATQREGLERGQEHGLSILTSGLEKLGMRTFYLASVCTSLGVV